MSLGEFELIALFKQQAVERDDVILGIGDDAALLAVPEGMQLVVTTDTLVEGTHFLPLTDPALVAYKALVSNISDLAAMGAKPAWCSLALTLPKADETWLRTFCRSFFKLASQYNIALIGGDTTKGPLAITITLHGFVKANQALRRNGAKARDLIFVTGELGDSHAGLNILLQQKNASELTDNEIYLANRHFHKVPRVETGQMLLNLASSCIDISDGLCADLTHILTANEVGAVIEADKLPISSELIMFAGDKRFAAEIALQSGEEYELCFTVAPNKLMQLKQLSLAHSVKLSCIGSISAGSELELTWQKQKINLSYHGWDHFQQQE